MATRPTRPGVRASIAPMASSISKPTATSRPGARQAARVSSIRPGHHGSLAARIDRATAPSPAESISSVATTGAKRKERDFEVDRVMDTNINVVVRCRGRMDREIRENSAVVVETDGVKGNVVELSMGASALSNKTYNFDRVFSPAADQSMLYEDVVKPILEEMLSGYNCTIFAYGQTGTGKTYTMSGDMSDTFGLLSDNAGIIPRVLHSLFKKLEADHTENFVKCSFIELYNEELRDLVSAEENAKLKIFDDTSRKGQASNIVQGMEECHIKTAAEGIKLLQNGSLKRQVAATKCNDLSSRSHTVFTITTAIKRTTEDGEEFVSTGKLNLVDLAGSENIQRSGAENKRAAEAGLINKSLLTLGRVINALVDRSSHIPYRESKLTRLLQDSLGGKTKTCIIATISPAKSNLEETISTLDYAFRAKNIRNKPQVNQMIRKETLLNYFTHEIERLKSELIATRHRNGVYLSDEGYEELTAQNESRRIQNEEQAAKIETMELNLRNKVQELFSLASSFTTLKKDHEITKTQLDETQEVLHQTELILEVTRKTLEEETHIRKAHQETEGKLHAVGGELISTIQKTISHVGGLHAKNKRKSDLQMLNRGNWAMAQDQVSDITAQVERRVEDFRSEQQGHIASISDRMQLFVQAELQKLSTTQKFLDQNLDLFVESKKSMIEQKDKSKDEMDEVLEEIKVVRDNIKERVGESLQSIAAAAERIAEDVLSELNTFHNQLHSSYSTLGKDFKSVFDDLLKHIHSQKQESDSLRQNVQTMGEIMVTSNTSMSARLQEVIADERKQAAEERQSLLLQITGLINSQSELQQSRLANKTLSLQQSIQENNTTFEGSMAQYSQGMDAWNDKEFELLDEVNKSREAMKTKLQDDWTTANQHSTSIQETTRSVHAETIRVVDEQMKDLDQQMTSLDDFVKRARSENSQHHDQQNEAVQSLSSTVESSYAKIADHFKTTFERVQELGTEMDTETATAQGALEPLNEDLCQPLAELRQEISGTALQEYQPTGDTPQKMAYEYPTDLPHTAAHETLIAKMNGAPSPSKRTIFSDADPTLPENRSPVLTRSSDSVFPLPDRNPFSMSLREVNPNVNSKASFHFDGRSSATIHGFSASVGPGVAPPHYDNDNTLPAFKRSRSGRSNRNSKKVTTTAEGRENIAPIAEGIVKGMEGREIFAQSTSRRKSPRLN